MVWRMILFLLATVDYVKDVDRYFLKYFLFLNILK
jgi:hypothetical protein